MLLNKDVHCRDRTSMYYVSLCISIHTVYRERRGQDTWIQEGLDRLDLLLKLCQMEEIRLILDLQSSTGGEAQRRYQLLR